MMLEHKSVPLEEAIESLNIKPDGIYVDGTLGGDGHALEVCRRLEKHRKMIGIDQDVGVIAAATEWLIGYKGRVIIVRSNYENTRTVLQDLGIRKVDGIYLDLGASSYQFGTADRGSTYWEDTSPDMRTDQQEEEMAVDIINMYSELDLYRIIHDYGEDKFAKNIVKHIVKVGEGHPIEATEQLIKIIKTVVPMKVRAVGDHPAKKTSRAIRIELNHELEVLNNSIDTMIELSNPGGRLSIATFHSLEGRIVKTKFRNNGNPCTYPPDFPVYICDKGSRGRVVTKKPIVPSEEEVEENKRSENSKLRVFERI